MDGWPGCVAGGRQTLADEAMLERSQWPGWATDLSGGGQCLDKRGCRRRGRGGASGARRRPRCRRGARLPARSAPPPPFSPGRRACRPRLGPLPNTVIWEPSPLACTSRQQSPQSSLTRTPQAYSSVRMARLRIVGFEAQHAVDVGFGQDAFGQARRTRPMSKPQVTDAVAEGEQGLDGRECPVAAAGGKGGEHIGKGPQISQDGGERIAVRKYLGAVLPGLGDVSIQRSPNSRRRPGPPAISSRGSVSPSSMGLLCAALTGTFQNVAVRGIDAK